MPDVPASPPSSAENLLYQRRTEAAAASRGISSEPILDAALAAVGRMVPGVALLEFGAGTGDLLRRLMNAGCKGRLTGTDILPRPSWLPEEMAWVQADLNQTTPLPGRSFDVIISTEVIEHLENPRAVAREFARLLRPGGRVVLTTPNQESIRSFLSLLITGHFVAFQNSCYPAHITALLRKDLQRIFAEAGFHDICFGFSDHGGIPKLPWVTWQQATWGLLRGRLFSDNLVMQASLPL
ncbi:methyltransferase domain-containing protein [Prosthecobacter sp.]|uniref:methyltransferase domain-containing protein n=1 Tax=Prosthecobacter sp. TaxID=1965333 RepID=UPI003782F1CC